MLALASFVRWSVRPPNEREIMTYSPELFPPPFDYRILHKYLVFLADTADQIIQSTEGISTSGDYFTANSDALHSRFRSLASEYARFISLLRDSPHINPELKRSIYPITLRSLGNPRVRLIDKLMVLFPSIQFDVINRWQYASRVNAVHVDILTEFRDRLTEIAIALKSSYL